MAKSAIITGGASGMGLAVAQALAARGGWDLHLVDLNAEAGKAAASSLPGATFHQADATKYASLAAAFEAAFKSSGRVDFVFANAGIAERDNFYMRHDTGSGPPPEPDMLVIKICLDAVVTTTYLAQHYFRQSPQDNQSLVMTASCGGIYPSAYSPMYSAAKHGVVGFMRCVATHFWHKDRIRVNAICPGTVRTNLLSQKEWQNFPAEYFTPVEKIVEAVLILVDGKDDTPAEKTRIDGVEADKKGVLWGEAVELSGANHYYRTKPKFSDSGMQAVMAATEMEEMQR
ncbi:uncharacterized protein E0L32_004932 [Thyridium curvatum]|uniref:NAD(P)-binding protein n=1 Tax=Thyridium curvatum TaxID=1093900 RepID=A0A507B4S9_9PEZI|nr:uncharacterized protein E0L32_004932 [Thyridium curvatum]TPX14823.1 hypothetical protein E0L32_004932 [Thyridium curvatum]